MSMTVPTTPTPTPTYPPSVEPPSYFAFIAGQALLVMIIGAFTIAILRMLLRPDNEEFKHFLVAALCITFLASISTSVVIFSNVEGGSFTLGAKAQIAVVSGTTFLGWAIARMYNTYISRTRIANKNQ